jgi:hypothetical protein
VGSSRWEVRCCGISKRGIDIWAFGRNGRWKEDAMLKREVPAVAVALAALVETGDARPLQAMVGVSGAEALLCAYREVVARFPGKSAREVVAGLWEAANRPGRARG